MTRALNTLHSTKRWHPHFDRVARVGIGERLEEVADGSGKLGSRYADSVGYSTGGQLLAKGNDGRAAVVGADARRCHASSLPERTGILGFDTSLRDYSTSGQGEFGHTP